MKKATIGLILSLISIFCQSQTTYNIYATSSADYNKYLNKWEWGEAKTSPGLTITIDGKHIYMNNKSETHLYLLDDIEKTVAADRTNYSCNALNKTDGRRCTFDLVIWDDKQYNSQIYIEYPTYKLCYTIAKF